MELVKFNPFCPNCKTMMLAKMRKVVVREEIDEEATEKLRDEHLKVCKAKNHEKCMPEPVMKRFSGLRKVWECPKCEVTYKRGAEVIRKKSKPLSDEEIKKLETVLKKEEKKSRRPRNRRKMIRLG